MVVVRAGRNQECATGSARAVVPGEEGNTGKASAFVPGEEENTGNASATHAHARLLCVPLALPVPSSLVRRGTLAKLVPHMRNT